MAKSLCSEASFNKMCNLFGVDLIYVRNEGCHFVNRLHAENDRIDQQLFTEVLKHFISEATPTPFLD